MEVETHWWGIELKFSKEEKEKLVSVVDIAGAGAGVGALAEALGAFEGIAALGAAAGGPIIAVIAAIIAVIAGELAACNLIGKGGFRICITWLVIALPPPLGSLTLTPLPVF